MSLALRAVVAIALTVVFYVFAVAVCVWLVTAPFAQIAVGNTPNLVVIVMPAIGATILFHLVPRRAPFAAPGPRLTREDQPELVAVIEEVARTVGHPVPDVTYLDADVNAGVLETRRKRGRRQR